jgi:hypothetical protein
VESFIARPCYGTGASAAAVDGATRPLYLPVVASRGPPALELF